MTREQQFAKFHHHHHRPFGPHWLDNINARRIGETFPTVKNRGSQKDRNTGYDITPGTSPADWDKGYSYSSAKGMLKYVGVPQPVLDWATAVTAHETNDYQSHVSTADKNLTGITWLNKPYQKNAVRGSAKPARDGGGYYARFKTYNDWAADYKRILSLGGSASPIRAKTLQDFVSRLKKNGYFGDSEKNYYNAIVSKIKKYSGINTAQQDKQKEGIEDWHIKHDKDPFPGSGDAIAWIKAHPLPAAGIAVASVVVISKLFGR